MSMQNGHPVDDASDGSSASDARDGSSVDDRGIANGTSDEEAVDEGAFAGDPRDGGEIGPDDLDERTRRDLEAARRERSRDIDFSQEDLDITESDGPLLEVGDDLDTGAAGRPREE